MMFVITQISSVPRFVRNGRTSRNLRRGTISSLTLTSSMNTRLTGSPLLYLGLGSSPHSHPLACALG